MPGIVFKLFGVAAIIVFILYTAASAFRRARLLDARIRALRREQEEMRRAGRVEDPYAALGEIYAEQESERLKKTRPDQKRR